MIIKKEDAHADIENRVDVERCPHLQTFAEVGEELGSQVAVESEEATRRAYGQKRQKRNENDENQNRKRKRSKTI